MEVKPMAVVIDSIQTLFMAELQSAPGTVSQVRESSGKLIFLAKKTGTPIFSRRARYKGRRDCGSEGAGTYGGHGTVF
jgi:predicted ATP-dependent serine protease